MRDHVHPGFPHILFEIAFHRRRPQTRVGPILGGIGEVDHGRFGRIAEQVQRLLRGHGTSGEDDRARLAQAGGVQLDDHRRFITHARQRAFAIVIGGDQLEVELRGGGRQIADLPPEQGFAAHQGYRRFIQSDAPVAAAEAYAAVFCAGCRRCE